jgi:hypothetical protein
VVPHDFSASANSWLMNRAFPCSCGEVISTGDDAIAIKSGLNQAGINFGMPSWNLRNWLPENMGEHQTSGVHQHVWDLI